MPRNSTWLRCWLRYELSKISIFAGPFSFQYQVVSPNPPFGVQHGQLLAVRVSRGMQWGDGWASFCCHNNLGKQTRYKTPLRTGGEGGGVYMKNWRRKKRVVMAVLVTLILEAESAVLSL